MNLPEWMMEDFSKGQCPSCKKELNIKGVYGHGIRSEVKKQSQFTTSNFTHYYEYKCPKCKDVCIFSFPANWDEFIEDMIELASIDMEGMPPQKSKITDEEIDEVKKSLESSPDLKEFLKKEGILRVDRPKPIEEDENK